MKKYIKILIVLLIIVLFSLFYFASRYHKEASKTKETVVEIDDFYMTLYGPYKKNDHLNKNASFGYQKDNIYISGIKEKKENYASLDDFIKTKDIDNKKLYNYTSTVLINKRLTSIYHNDKDHKYILYSTYLETGSNYVEILMWSNKTILSEYKAITQSIRRKK